MGSDTKNLHRRSLEALGISETAEAVVNGCVKLALDNRLTVREFNQALDYAKVLAGHCKLTI